MFFGLKPEDLNAREIANTFAFPLAKSIFDILRQDGYRNLRGFCDYLAEKLYLYTVKSKITKKMEVTTARKPSRRRKKLTPEERKAINAAKPAGNKYVEAARRHQGEVWVKDPMLML